MELSSPSGSRKRKNDPESWTRNKKKKARNLGLEYVQHYSDRVVPAKTVGEPCSCSLGCFDQLGHEAVQKIHKDFWALGDFDLQTGFVQKFVSLEQIKRRYTNNPESRLNLWRKYHLEVNGVRKKVCKTAFIRILGISHSRVDRALKSKTSEGVLIPDQRGRHANHPQLPLTQLERTIQHINSFPTVKSHYSRKDNGNLRYLDSTIT